MDIVTTHVTRMQPGYVCVAGQRVGDDASIRPVLLGMRLPRSAISLEGGPFWPGNRVSLGQTSHCGSPPETEDHAFQLANTRLVARETPPALWSTLLRCARRSFKEIFGPDLKDEGATAAMPEGRGSASLGILKPKGRPHATVFEDAVKLHVSDGQRDLSVRVTDIRLYAADHKSLDDGALQALVSRLSTEPCLLAVGVGRPWLKPGDAIRRHWLQVNGIHFPGGPDWTS